MGKNRKVNVVLFKTVIFKPGSANINPIPSWGGRFAPPLYVSLNNFFRSGDFFTK